MTPLAISLLAAVTALWAAGCSEPKYRFDIQLLASDLHFAIGDHYIVIPVFAVDTADRTFALGDRDPSLPAEPAPADSLGLRIRPYKADYPELREMCTLLKRQWSRAVCLSEHGRLLRRLPERFELLDRRKLGLLQHHWTVGKERRFDQVKDMAFAPGITEIGCDQQTAFCTAAVEVLPGLLAVWTVWSDEKAGATARAMAESQGDAIVQLVGRGLGKEEDPTLAEAM